MPNLIITRNGALAGPPSSPPLSTPDIVLNPHNPSFCKAAAEGVFKVNGDDYIRKMDKARKGDIRKSTSFCWQRGVSLLRVVDQKEFYYCFECEDQGETQTLPSLYGTTGGRNHIRGIHCRDPDTGEPIVKEKKVDNDASAEPRGR